MLNKGHTYLSIDGGKTKGILEKSNCYSVPPPLLTSCYECANITIITATMIHRDVWYEIMRKARFWSLPVVLTTIIWGSLWRISLFFIFASFFSHLLLVKTHHQIVLLIITISFSMHQHRRRLIIGKDCAKVFIKLRIVYNSDLIKLTICFFQASSSRQLRRSVWRTVVRPPTSPASSPSSSTGCSTTSAHGPPHTSLSINHGAQLLSTRLVSFRNLLILVF